MNMKWLYRIIPILAIITLAIPHAPIQAMSTWADTDYPYRFEVTVESDYVDVDEYFPFVIDDAPEHFWDNVQDDGADILVCAEDKTKLYAELATWSYLFHDIELWVNGALSSTVDAVFYVYYGIDIEWEDNDYTGLTGSLPAQSVWDENFVFVSHMNDNPAGDGILDSTSNGNHGTKVTSYIATTSADITNGTGTLASSPTTVAAGTGTTTTVTVTGAGTFNVTIPPGHILKLEKGTVDSVSITWPHYGNQTITVTGTGTFYASWYTDTTPTEIDSVVGKAQQMDAGSRIIVGDIDVYSSSWTVDALVSATDVKRFGIIKQGYGGFLTGLWGGNLDGFIFRENADVIDDLYYYDGALAKAADFSEPLNGRQALLSMVYTGTNLLVYDDSALAGNHVVDIDSNDVWGLTINKWSDYESIADYDEIRISNTARDEGWISTTNNSMQESGFTVTGEATVYPCVATNFNYSNLISQQNYASIDLSWDYCADEIEYTVVRSETWYPLNTLDGEVRYSGSLLGFTDTFTPGENTYYYSIFSTTDLGTNASYSTLLVNMPMTPIQVGGNMMWVIIPIVIAGGIVIFAVRANIHMGQGKIKPDAVMRGIAIGLVALVAILAMLGVL